MEIDPILGIRISSGPSLWRGKLVKYTRESKAINPAIEPAVKSFPINTTPSFFDRPDEVSGVEPSVTVYRPRVQPPRYTSLPIFFSRQSGSLKAAARGVGRKQTS
jgi:hypothetical protein